VNAIKLWKDKEKKLVDPKLFSTEAEDLAKLLAADNANSRGKKANKRTQIRKFYDEILRLDSMAQAHAEEWGNILPYVHMMVAKTSYAFGRELVSNQFLNFMRASILQIEEKEDLSVFANFFEAFMGFYRQHGPSN